MKRGNDTPANRAIVADYLGQSDPMRTMRIIDLRLNGKSLAAIKEETGLSQERVRQILARFTNQLKRALKSPPSPA